MARNNPCGLYAAPGLPDRHVYCGPTAIAALTGIPAVQVEAAVVAYREKHGTPRRNVLKGAVVRSMWSTEIEPIAAALGYHAIERTIYPSPTFSGFIRARSRAKETAPFLVLVTQHFVAYRDGWFADSGQRNPIPAKLARHKRKRVQRVWQFVKQEG